MREHNIFLQDHCWNPTNEFVLTITGEKGHKNFSDLDDFDDMADMIQNSGRSYFFEGLKKIGENTYEIIWGS